ncbi:hypothetical protein [Gottfriedia acidiceleris]|uniref:hypothetical protein n=1 Tax=Gottfriedia acidiceleris TaxID=371036 RepID=UPI003D1BBAA4
MIFKRWKSIEEQLKALLTTHGEDEEEFWKKNKVQWKLLEKITGHSTRQTDLAKNIIQHFSDNAPSFAKGMTVTMTSENAVSLLKIIRTFFDAPQMEVIISGDITKDPEEYHSRRSRVSLY